LLTGYTKSGANLGDYTTAQVIQTALVLVGTLKETEVDGVYGPITKSAIQSFENSAGIDSSLYGEALGKGTINELIKKIYS
jgi:peptidoglycan hydrolase-like protein with peptidoglycan-binding domain